MPTSIDTEKISEIQNSEETWIIDFWAEWCGPCETFGPVFEEVSEEIEEVSFGKVDMEEYKSIGADLGVRALPTVLILREGEEIARSSGSMSKKEFKDWVQENT